MSILAGAVVLGILAYLVSPWFVLPGVLLIVGWGVICQRRIKRDEKRLNLAFDDAFRTFPGIKPELEKSSSYGFPFFSVCFETKDEMKRAIASGHVGAFKGAIVQLYGHGGFDITKGFEATYRGWKEDFLVSLKIDPSGNTWIAEKVQQAKEADRVSGL